MNILMIHPHDVYDDLEPWTVRITCLAEELVQRGNVVKLVYHLRDPLADCHEAGARQEFSFETIPLPRFMPGLLNRCRAMERFAHWADVVHFQKCHHYSALPAVFGAYYHRRPIHYDWDDWEQRIFELDNDNRIGSWIFFNQMEKQLLKLVDTVSVASEGLRSLAVQLGFPEDRIFAVPVGVDLQLFSPKTAGETTKKASDAAPVVLYHGQISGANYVHLFIRAAAKIATRWKDVRFLVVGGGDHLDEAKDLAAHLDSGHRIVFTGEVPHRKVPEYIAQADIAVACFEDNEQSRCKSPLKLVEYMASGAAIVASRVGEVPRMLGDCGILVEPDSVDAIVLGIEKLLAQPELRLSLSIKARKHAEKNHGWAIRARTMTDAYMRAMSIHHCLE